MTETPVPAARNVDSTDTGVAATDLPSYIEDATGLPEASPTTPRVEPAAPPELTSPEAAAASWLAAWCPIDPHRNPDAVSAAIHAAMTPAGWAQFTATPGQAMASGVPGVTASCDAP